jgi:NAD+ kinase
VRPILIPNNREIRFNVTGRYHDFNVSLDSRGSQIPTGSEMRIKKADFRINLINLEGQNFFTTLRNKMMWGIDRRQ